MEEKKEIKISLSTFFLVLAIIVIIIMGYLIYKLYNEKAVETDKIYNLKNEIISLQNTVSQLNEAKGNISNTINNVDSVNNTNMNNDISSVYLKINCNGTDISNSFKKGENFEFDLLGKKYKITINNITENKIELKSNSYGLFPKREDGTISLIDNVDTFELYKNKKLVLSFQATDVSSNVEIIWE